MKQLLFLILLTISLNCLAADPQANMLAGQPPGVKAMVACLQKINKADMQRMKNYTRTMMTKIAGLCKTGNRSEAVKEARIFVNKSKNDPVVSEMNKCTALAGVPANHSQVDASKITINNVCSSSMK